MKVIRTFKVSPTAVAAPVPAGDGADLIVRPSHYVGHGGIECIQVIHDWGLSYDLGTALAYVLRHARKGEPIRDLKKARRHLQMASKSQMTRVKAGVPFAYLGVDVARAFDLPDMLVSAVSAIAVAAVEDADGYIGMHIDDLEKAAARDAADAAAARATTPSGAA